MSRPDADQWAEAIEAKLKGIEDMGVWEVIYDCTRSSVLLMAVWTSTNTA